MSFTYEYPRPALTADAVLLTISTHDVFVLLVERKYGPHKDEYAFPGGFVNEGETAYEAVKRELEEETSIKGIDLDELCVASKPGRDPRGWTISVVYTCLLKEKISHIEAGDDAANVGWHSISNCPNLAFDHEDILAKALEFHKNLAIDTLLRDGTSLDRKGALYHDNRKKLELSDARKLLSIIK